VDLKKMDDKTKGKLIDGTLTAGAITAGVAATALGIALGGIRLRVSRKRNKYGLHSVGIATIPSPTATYQALQRRRAAADERAAIIAEGCFEYRHKYRVRYSEQNARWEWGEVDPADGKMWLDGYCDTAEECMRQIDQLQGRNGDGCPRRSVRRCLKRSATQMEIRQ
jgi:hypothetical protein